LDFCKRIIDFHKRFGSSLHVLFTRVFPINIREFVDETDSVWGAHLLENFEDYVGKFWLVKPKAADINQLLSRLRETD